MERFDAALQLDGVVVNAAGHRNVGARLTADFPPLGLSAGDLLAVDVDGNPIQEGFVVVSVDGGLFITRCVLRGRSFCFWFRGQRWPVTRATWGDKKAPVVFGTVIASGRVF